MKYLFLAVFGAFFIGYFGQYIKALGTRFCIWLAKRKATNSDLWLYD